MNGPRLTNAFWPIFIALVALCLAGCGHDENATGLTKDGKILLTVWETYNDEEHDYFQRLADEYEKLHGNVEIRSQRIPFVGAEPKILTALATHTTPDIARLDVSFVAKLGLRNALVMLDTLGVAEIKQQYLPAALGSCLLKGKMYAIPEQVNGLCLFYDKDRFSEVGLDPNQPPRTWAEFIDYGKKLTDPAKNRWGVGLRNSLWFSFPFFNTYGAKFLSDDTKTCLLNSPEGLAATQLQYDLYHTYKIEGGAWRSGGIRDDTGFPGVYAMVLSGPWSIKSYKDRQINFGVALIPAGPAGTSTNVGGQDMVIFRTCRHPKEAYNFLKWLTGKETQARWCNELGQIPVNYEAYPLIDVQKYPEMAVFMEQMKTAIPRPQIFNYSDIENLFIREFEAVMTGSKPLKQALDDVCRQANTEYLIED